MRGASVGRLTRGLAALVTVAVVVIPACSGAPSVDAGGDGLDGGVADGASDVYVDGDAPADARVDADAKSDGVGDASGCFDAGSALAVGGTARWTPNGILPAWDATWHLATARGWPTLDVVTTPQCGPGCALELGPVGGITFPPSVVPSASAFGATSFGVVAREGGANNIVSLSDAGEHAVAAYLSNDGKFVVYHSYSDCADEWHAVVLQRIDTGERKVVWQDRGPGADNIRYSSVNSQYVFWTIQGVGLARRDLASGEARIISPEPECLNGWCVTEAQVMCLGAGLVYGIDQQTGIATATDVAHGYQAHASCDVARRAVALIDDRATGAGLTSEFNRNGGEVYVLDTETWTMTRRTLDPPGVVRQKFWPVVDGENVAWLETLPGYEPNPPSLAAARIGVLATLDPVTGATCRSVRQESEGFRPVAMRGRVVLGRATHPEAWPNSAILLSLNLDDPGLTWDCTPAP